MHQGLLLDGSTGTSTLSLTTIERVFDLKTVRLPRDVDYPVTVEECHVVPDQLMGIGNELCQLKTASGKLVSIKSPHQGIVAEVSIYSGQILTSPHAAILIDDNSDIPHAAIGISEAAREKRRLRSRAIKAESPHQDEKQSSEKEQVKKTLQPGRKKVHRKSKSPNDTKPAVTNATSRFGLTVFWLTSMVLLFYVLWPIAASGAYFWEHILFTLGLGVFPLAIIWSLLRRLNSNSSEVVTPKGFSLFIMCIGYWGVAFITSQPSDIKDEYVESVRGFPKHIASFSLFGVSNSLVSAQEIELRKEISQNIKVANSTVFFGHLNKHFTNECVDRGIISKDAAKVSLQYWAAKAMVGKEYLSEQEYVQMVDMAGTQFSVYGDKSDWSETCFKALSEPLAAAKEK